MNYSLAQIIMASRTDDVESWMNILFVVVLAVFWAVAGIIKAKARKRQPEDQEESTAKPPATPQPLARALRELLTQQPASPARPRPSPPSAPNQPTRGPGPPPITAKLAAQAKRASRPQIIDLVSEDLVPEPAFSPPTAPAQPNLTELPEYTTRAVEQLHDKRAAVPEQMAPTQNLAGLLSDYADPEELRRAILHYEILGRPLSLRDPSGHIIGL